MALIFLVRNVVVCWRLILFTLW